MTIKQNIEKAKKIIELLKESPTTKKHILNQLIEILDQIIEEYEKR